MVMSDSHLKEKLVPFTDAEQHFIHSVVDKRSKAERKYPLLFGLFITFGFVATLYGFEKIIDKFALFQDSPWILLAIGIATLVATGAAYKKLN